MLGLAFALRPCPSRADSGGLLRRVFQPGVEGEVWTVKGEALRLDKIRLMTPRDFETLPADEPILTFIASPAPPDFRKIQKINLNPLSTSYLSSRPDAMEFYHLGNIRNAVPPPPDWQRSINQIPPWKHAQATTDVAGLPFLNHAVFCWTGQPKENEKEVGVYLFRQGFNIPHPENIVRATLRLASNTEPLEGTFNEYPLHLGPQQAFAIGEFEVTPLLQAGPNIFALKVRERPGVPAGNYGVAFHLELVQRNEQTPARPLDPTATLVTSDQGDRLWGSLRDLRGDRLLLNSNYGLYGLEWDGCSGVLFPGGWHAAKPRPGALERLFSAPPQPPADLRLLALPLALMPHPLQDCLLLTEGRTTTAKPSYVTGNALFFEGSEGKQYSVPIGEVVGIYPPRVMAAQFKRPSRQVAVLYCQLSTTSGESICGVLRELDSDRTIIESNGGQILTVPTDMVASILFPYHASTLSPAEARRGEVGLLTQIPGMEAYQAAYNNDSRQVQAAAFAIGTDCKLIDKDALANPAKLNPDKYHAVVSVDPVGEYLHTLGKPGDAQATLARYVEEGGNLIVLSRGGAFRTAVKSEKGQFSRSAEASELNRLLDLRTVRPDSPVAGVKAFDHPPNGAGEVFFQRSSQLPEGLSALPRRISLSPMPSAPFYPMISRRGQGTVVYELRDGSGTNFGPAMMVIPKGRGSVVVVDHLLWESRLDERPFSQRVLPILLHWALTTTSQP